MHIFISYKRTLRSNEARYLDRELRSRGFKTFFDQDDIPHHDTWMSKVEKEIDKANLFITLLDRNENHSGGFFDSEQELIWKKIRNYRAKMVVINFSKEEIPNDYKTNNIIIAKEGQEWSQKAIAAAIDYRNSETKRFVTIFMGTAITIIVCAWLIFTEWHDVSILWTNVHNKIETNNDLQTCKLLEGRWELGEEDKYIFWHHETDKLKSIATATHVAWDPHCIEEPNKVILTGIDVTEHTITLNGVIIGKSSNATRIDVFFKDGKPITRQIGSMNPNSLKIELENEITSQFGGGKKRFIIFNTELSWKDISNSLSMYKTYTTENKGYPRDCPIANWSNSHPLKLIGKCQKYTKTLTKSTG
ncbi:MAG: hypothetical protein DM484_05475 [Candidatus Methylumidiphilus alinenensis]|uniref:TIR domain-containing protein n=1 Tax=Candidatus Methylumidiphilus alinenensis TaxID=2202197 RepID=A0A2W4RN85_9GAMM|nr:MAG: hypothetical protein DM484_05475 [Candidatus Methylumidiphilus alinenensis]